MLHASPLPEGPHHALICSPANTRPIVYGGAGVHVLGVGLAAQFVDDLRVQAFDGPEPTEPIRVTGHSTPGPS